MEKIIKSSFRVANKIRIYLIALFFAIAWYFFDVRVAMFTLVIAILLHELPSLFMGVLITKVIKGVEDEKDN